jgi:hypothetical protein
MRSTRPQPARIRGYLAGLAIAVAGAVPGAERVSVDTSGVQFDSASQVAISGDGRFVVFLGRPRPFAPPDDTCEQWYLRDRRLGTTELVSRRPDGQPATCNLTPLGSARLTTGADLSADGRYVVFDYSATDIVPGLGPPYLRAYLLDRETSVVRLVLPGAQGVSAGPQIDDSGNRVLVWGEGSSSGAGTFRLVRTTALSDEDLITLPGALAESVRMSNGGEKIVYLGRDAGAPVGTPRQVHVYDIASRSSELVSVTSEGAPLGASTELVALRPAISGDGDTVVYESFATNQYPEAPLKIVARILSRRQNILVSRDASGNALQPFLFQDSPAVSRDGRIIAFRSNAQALPGAADGLSPYPQAYAFDRQTGRTHLLSETQSGRGTLHGSSNEFCEGPGLPSPCGAPFRLSPAVSSDGRFVAFHARGPDLVSPDANGIGLDVYVADLAPLGLLPRPSQVPAGSWWTAALLLAGLAGVGILALRRPKPIP